MREGGGKKEGAHTLARLCKYRKPKTPREKRKNTRKTANKKMLLRFCLAFFFFFFVFGSACFWHCLFRSAASPFFFPLRLLQSRPPTRTRSPALFPLRPSPFSTPPPSTPHHTTKWSIHYMSPSGCAVAETSLRSLVASSADSVRCTTLPAASLF